MCECFKKMIEKGYADKQSYYDKDLHDFIETDNYVMQVGNDRYMVVHHCPVCGEKITQVKKVEMWRCPLTIGLGSTEVANSAVRSWAKANRAAT